MKNFMNTIISLIFCLVPLSLARAGQLSCDGPTSRTVEMPGKTPLKYFFLPAKNPKGTLVYLEGGPKPSSIRGTEEALRAVGKISPHLNVIAMDYRGEGCNKVKVQEFTDTPQNFSSSEYANDIAAIIKDAGLKDQEFIVTGTSYGSLVATKYASSLKDGDPKPLLVVLWSSVAGPYPAHCDQDCWVNRMFIEQFKRLPPQQQTYFQGFESGFKSNNMPALLGYAGSVWRDFLENIVQLNGYVFTGVLDAVYKVSALNDETAKTNPFYTRSVSLLASMSKDSSAEDDDQPKIDSSPDAILDDQFMDQWILNTELKWFQKNIGTSLPAPYSLVKNHAKTFYSRKFDSKAPMLFIQGKLDPVTPYVMAFDAFVAKQAPEKYFAEVVNDSHTLGSLNCGPDFFDQLLDFKDVKKALPSLEQCTTLHSAAEASY